ncbi:hypothetical protein SDC9_165513 [bioreactor metagenome]|uniref:Uncharacterized protein n=1 Tax=bioreactor metagenome TaxID=1076179 RepID=A0A645FUL4_9ZZZZ
MNSWLCGGWTRNAGVKRNKIVLDKLSASGTPSETIILGDAVQGIVLGENACGIAIRHGNSVNTAMLDGHIAAVKPAELGPFNGTKRYRGYNYLYFLDGRPKLAL